MGKINVFENGKVITREMTAEEEAIFTIPEIAYKEKIIAKIRERYSIDDEIALLNNYNLDNEKYKQEYEEYQEYRKQCKEQARLN